MKKSSLVVLLGLGALLLLGGGTAVYLMTRGLRNNNPGNIRRTSTAWQGMALEQSDPDFVTFVSPEYGIRAMAKILASYANNGVTKLSDIINRWAPPTENDTANYVLSVANHTGLSPESLISTSQWPALIAAIIQHENGLQPYDLTTLHNGISLALNG